MLNSDKAYESINIPVRISRINVANTVDSGSTGADGIQKVTCSYLAAPEANPWFLPDTPIPGETEQDKLSILSELFPACHFESLNQCQSKDPSLWLNLSRGITATGKLTLVALDFQHNQQVWCTSKGEIKRKPLNSKIDLLHSNNIKVIPGTPKLDIEHYRTYGKKPTDGLDLGIDYKKVAEMSLSGALPIPSNDIQSELIELRKKLSSTEQELSNALEHISNEKPQRDAERSLKVALEQLSKDKEVISAEKKDLADKEKQLNLDKRQLKADQDAIAYEKDSLERREKDARLMDKVAVFLIKITDEFTNNITPSIPQSELAIKSKDLLIRAADTLRKTTNSDGNLRDWVLEYNTWGSKLYEHNDANNTLSERCFGTMGKFDPVEADNGELIAEANRNYVHPRGVPYNPDDYIQDMDAFLAELDRKAIEDAVRKVETKAHFLPPPDKFLNLTSFYDNNVPSTVTISLTKEDYFKELICRLQIRDVIYVPREVMERLPHEWLDVFESATFEAVNLRLDDKGVMQFDQVDIPPKYLYITALKKDGYKKLFMVARDFSSDKPLLKMQCIGKWIPEHQIVDMQKIRLDYRKWLNTYACITYDRDWAGL